MELRRLLEENPTDIERALLNAGAAYRCSSTSRAKTLSALGFASTAAVTATVVGVSTTSVVAKIGWAKIAVGIAALAAVTAVPVGYFAFKHANQSQMPATYVEVAKDVTPSPQALNETGQRSPVEPAPALAPDDNVSKNLPVTRVEPKTESNTALSEELSALDAARSILAQGDPSGALVRLDNYNKAFPKGRLQLEAEVLRIDALMKSGQQELARKRAQAFLAKHPKSVLASRVRGLL